MHGLTAKEENHTDLECDLCVHSPIIYYAVLPYALTSLPANGRVLWLMKSSPVFWTDRMQVSEFHLVLTELLFGLLVPTLLNIRYFSNSEVSNVVTKFITMIVTARIQFQSSVCLERYLAVVHPVLYLRFKPLRYRMSLCCFIWLQAILLGIVPMFFCSDDVMSVSLSTSSFIFVFIINSFCSLSVLRALKRPSPGDGGREGSNMTKKRAFNIVLIFQLTTVIGYAPLVTMFLLVKKIDVNILCILQPLAYSMMIWLGVVYPLLYLLRAEKHLKKQFMCKLLAGVKMKKKTNPSL